MFVVIYVQFSDNSSWIPCIIRFLRRPRWISLYYLKIKKKSLRFIETFLLIWRPPSLRELTPMIFGREFTHLGLEASIYYMHLIIIIYITVKIAYIYIVCVRSQKINFLEVRFLKLMKNFTKPFISYIQRLFYSIHLITLIW